WAIHTPLSSSDGGEQPHVHLMFSERQVDGIERGPDQYFKRANSKAPERGGAKKGYGPRAGERLSRAERAEDLKALRGRWEGMANDHLARAGREERIDMRSYADRGLDIAPASRLLPSEWRDGEQRGNVIAFRRATAELVQAEQAIGHAIPDRDAQIIDLERERAKRALAESFRGLRPEAARGVTEEPVPTASPEAIVQRWTAEHQRQLAAVQAKARRVMGHAEGMERQHRGRVEDHRRQQPEPPKGLLMAFKQASYDTAKQAWDKVADGLWRRAQQLRQRIERLEDYLKPIDRHTLHHPGDKMAHERMAREHPALVKDHAQAVKAQTLAQAAEQAKRTTEAREKIRQQREKERGRDDRGRGR
ncbi:MobA/MobL family protein, partial [Sphingomonas sp. PAMC 26605]|uniref:MobA/MobL family protein n=1 Tax=Sphingomonas sp. PAMC 26605 TaxID=1112214 RepID=UPI00026CDE80